MSDNDAEVCPLVVLDAVTAEVARALRDSGAYFADARGAYGLGRGDRDGGKAGSSVARAVASELDAVVADPARSFVVLDLFAGTRDPVAERQLRPGTRPPERFCRDPLELVWWLLSTPGTLAWRLVLRSYLFASDPDDILPRFPWHGIGPDAEVDPDAAVAGAARVAVVTVPVRRGTDPVAARRLLVADAGRLAIVQG